MTTTRSAVTSTDTARALETHARGGIRTLTRALQAGRARRAQDPERAARRRHAREIAALPATRGVGGMVSANARSGIR